MLHLWLIALKFIPFREFGPALHQGSIRVQQHSGEIPPVHVSACLSTIITKFPKCQNFGSSADVDLAAR